MIEPFTNQAVLIKFPGEGFIDQACIQFVCVEIPREITTLQQLDACQFQVIRIDRIDHRCDFGPFQGESFTIITATGNGK